METGLWWRLWELVEMQAKVIFADLLYDEGICVYKSLNSGGYPVRWHIIRTWEFLHDERRCGGTAIGWDGLSIQRGRPKQCDAHGGGIGCLLGMVLMVLELFGCHRY